MLPRTATDTQVLNDTRIASTNSTPYTQGLGGVNQIGNYVFINSIVGFFMLLCVLTLFLRWARMANNHLRHISAVGHSQTTQAYWEDNKTSYWPWIKRHVLFAPLWRNRHNREIQLSTAVSIGTLPSRFHVVLLGLYVISNIAFCFVLDYSQEDRAAVIAELRGRSGALASINLIPTIVFALRNNPLISLLRVSYDTFNLFHRYAARIVVIEVIIHVVAWSVNAIDAGGLSGLHSMLSESLSFQWGLVACVFFVVMAFTAWAPIRHAFYETFVNMHRLFALIALIGVYVHLDIGKLPQLPYIQIVFTFWSLELSLRIIRIIYYNYSRTGATQVTVEALPNEACRVTFLLARQWKFRPGCHVHAYFPDIGLWSSHPFSVAWGQDHLAPTPKDTLPTTNTDLDSTGSVRTSLSLIVRARTGMTRKLFVRASAAPGRTLITRGFIEGPYGGHEPLDSYGTVLLFAGGVGITHQIGYLAHLVRGYEASTVATRKVILVWSVPNTETLEWIRPWMDEVLKMKSRRHVLKVLLFVTKPKSQKEIISGTGTVQMYPGRCNPQTVIDKEILERVGAMVVQTCGSGSFSDSVRAAARKRVQHGSVDFIEEAFTY